MPDIRADRVVWVLSGGGAQGAVQVGMMGTLIDHGHVPDLIVAASVGSLNAAFIAHDPSLRRVDELQRRWEDVSVASIFGTRREAALNVMRRRPSLFPSDRLRGMLRSWMDAERIEDLPVPLRVATTRLADGRQTHHDTGDLIDVLAASAAVPALLPPVLLDGEWHVDGGVSQNVPLSGVTPGPEGSRTHVFVLDATHAAKQRPMRTPIDSLVAALAATLAGQRPHPLPDDMHVTHMNAGGTVSIVDFSKTRSLVKFGANVAFRALNSPVPMSV